MLHNAIHAKSLPSNFDHIIYHIIFLGIISHNAPIEKMFFIYLDLEKVLQ